MALKIAFQKSAVMGGADSRFINQFNLIKDIVIVLGYGFVLPSVLPLVIARDKRLSRWPIHR